MTTLEETPPSAVDQEPKEIPLAGGFLPSADTVRSHMEKGGANAEEVGSVLWLLGHARAQGMRSYGELGKLINRDSSTMSRVLRGVYKANLREIVAEIEYAKKIDGERRTLGEQPIIRTSLMVNIAQICDLVRATATMGRIWGDNQTGKTEALLDYTRANNHGRTIYVRTPTGGGTGMFQTELLRACNISCRNSVQDCRDRTFKYFNGNMLLIVDEFHQCLIGRSIKSTTVEFVREIHDKTGVGVVICGTNVVEDMFSKAKFAPFLGQTNNRGVIKLYVPSAPPLDDVRKICKGYGFPDLGDGGEAFDRVCKIGNTSGIGVLTKYLLMSRRLATRENKKPAWGHFLATVATLKGWSEGVVASAEKKEAA